MAKDFFRESVITSVQMSQALAGIHITREEVARLYDEVQGQPLPDLLREVNMDEASEQALVEELAAIEHQRWADWQLWMHQQCAVNDDGSLTIPAGLVERWNQQIATPYERLSGREKESDREQVRRYLHLLQPRGA